MIPPFFFEFLFPSSELLHFHDLWASRDRTKCYVYEIFTPSKHSLEISLVILAETIPDSPVNHHCQGHQLESNHN